MVILALTACLRSDEGGNDPPKEQPGLTTPAGGCDERCDAVAPTVRFARLTHLQWENTVQDLLYLDGPTGLSETFLGDTLSKGFENNADNLQIGPELWQDYQRAAETLAERIRATPEAYTRVVPQDPRTADDGPSFEGHIEGEDPQAIASTGAATGSAYNLWSQGTLQFPIELPANGRYTLTARVWADQAGRELARASLGLDGETLLTTEVVASAQESAELLQVEVEATAGPHVIVVSFHNDYYQDGGDRNLYIDWVEIAGGGGGFSPSVAGEAERDAWIASFGERAHRRPLLPEELDSYAALFDLGPELVDSGDDFADGVQLVVTAMLQSPWFLYRIEQSDKPGPDGTIPLSDWELASKLSYALWNTMPDEALFAAARSGALSTDEGLRAEAERLLADPRAQAMFADLHRQLLMLDSYDNIHKDSTLYPMFTETTPASMRAEAAAFVEDVVWNDGSVHDLFTSTRTFVNADLAPIYGLSGPYGDELVPVNLDHRQRSGLLTLSGFLALEADSYISSPIRRGVFVNLKVWCVDLPPPPDVVPPLPPNPGQVTTRELVEAHTGEGTCGEGCHSTLINPPGYALENFDAIGRFRLSEFGLPIDASGSYNLSTGPATWTDAVQFSSMVGNAIETHRCWNQHLLEYLHARPKLPEDNALLDYLAQQSLAEDRPIRELVLELVLARSFRARSTEVQ